MKIAVVTEVLNNHSGSRAPINLALALRYGTVKQKNKVIIFSLAKNSNRVLKKTLEKQGLSVILFENAKLIAGFKLLLTLRSLKPDVISFHATTTFLIFAKLSNIPIVKTYYGTQHDAHYESIFPQKISTFDKIFNLLLNWVVLFLENLQFKISDKTIGISKYTQKQALKLFAEKIEYVYLGSNLLNSSNSSNGKYILSVSRFTPYKGFHKLLKLIKKYPIIIVGSTEKRDYLNYLKKIKGPNSQIKVNVSDQELSTLYKNCLFLACFDKYPFFGMPILEAASFSKTTVALNYGAVPELIENGKTGYVAENEKEFKKMADKLIKNPSLVQKLGTNAKIRSNQFDWNKTATSYLNIFKNVKPNFLSSIEIFLIIIIAIIIRVAFLNQHDFWFDEAFTYFIAEKNIKSTIIASLGDNTPPLYYILLSLWMRLGTTSVVWMRSFSLIFGALTIPLIYFFTKKIFSKEIAKTTAFLSTLSPLFLYFSAETRMYTLLTFLTLASTFALYLYSKKGTLINLVLFNTLFVISIYVHYIAVLLLIPVWILILKTKLIKNFLVSQISALIFVLPLFYGYFNFEHPNVFSTPALIALPATFASFIAAGTGIFSIQNYFDNLISLTIFAITYLYFALLTIKSLANIKDNNQMILFFLFFPIIMLFAANLFIPVFSVRSTIVLAPFFYIMLAKTLSSLPILCTYIALMLFLALDTLLLVSPTLKGPSLKATVNLIDREIANAHTSILSYYPFLYYNPSSKNLLIGKNPLSKTTQSIIGGYKTEIESLPYTFYLTEYENGQDANEVNELKNVLNKKYSILNSWNLQGIKIKLLSQ